MATAEVERLAAACLFPGFEGLAPPDWVRSWLERYQKRTSCTMLLASHNMGEVERMCDDVVMLRAGEVVDR